MATDLEFSVIIPICHGGELLSGALDSLKAIDFAPSRFELLVAGLHDDTESRRTVQKAAKDAAFDVIYVGCEESRRSNLLNRACGAARGRLLAFADDDCVFVKDWLKAIKTTFSLHPDAGIVGGQDEPAHNASAFYQALNSVLNSFLGTGGLRSGAGVRVGKFYPKLWNMAVPRDVALDVAIGAGENGRVVFDESISVHEDVELADRIVKSGRHILYAPRMRIGHERDTTYLSFARRNFKMAQVCRLHGIHKIPHICLSGFVLSLPLIVFAVVFAPSPFQGVGLSFFYLYLFALLASAVIGARKTGSNRVIPIIPCLMFTLHLCRGMGFLWPNKKGFRKSGCIVNQRRL